MAGPIEKKSVSAPSAPVSRAAKPPVKTPEPAVPKATGDKLTVNTPQTDPAVSALPGSKTLIFSDPASYQKLVSQTEDKIKAARARVKNAEVNKGRVDQETKALVDQEVAKRDQHSSEVIKPLDTAKRKLEAKQKELQAPIDAGKKKLEDANSKLVDVTYPNKRELDKARASAHTELDAARQEASQAQASLDQTSRQLNQATNDLESNQRGLSQARYDLSSRESELSTASSKLNSARYYVPSDYDWQRANQRLDQARTKKSDIGHDIHALETEIHNLNEKLDAANRPTPPAATPPAGGGRPVPPSADPTDTSGIRRRLDTARSELSNAQSRLGNAKSELASAERQVSEMQSNIDTFDQWQARVTSLKSEIADLHRDINIYSNNVHSLESSIPQLKSELGQRAEQRDEANQTLNAAQDQADKLDNTPYKNGVPSKIKAQQAIVDSLADGLKKSEQAYEAGMKVVTDRVSKEQATYDAEMAPFHENVKKAEESRKSALAQASATVSSANSSLQDRQRDYATLKDVPTMTAAKWKMFGGFSPKTFWSARPQP